MVTTTQSSGVSVYVYRRDKDGIEISIVTNDIIVAMYGPKGRKFFPTLIDAQMCAEKHGFEPETSFDFVG